MFFIGNLQSPLSDNKDIYVTYNLENVFTVQAQQKKSYQFYYTLRLNFYNFIIKKGFYCLKNNTNMEHYVKVAGMPGVAR